MIRRPPRSTLSSSSAASDGYKRQVSTQSTGSSIHRKMGRKMVSGSMHGEKFWEQESGNKGMAMMKGMGWSKGDGLGADGQGTKDYIRSKKREDNRGIGATTSGDNMWYSAIGDVFNSVLQKLNKPAAERDGDDEEEAPEVPGLTASQAIKRAGARRGLYSKFVKAKDSSQYSKEDLAKITGKVEGMKKKVEVSDSDDDSEEEDKAVPTKNAKVSMADYFAQKQAEAGIAPRRSPRLAAMAEGDVAFEPLSAKVAAQKVAKKVVVYNNRSHSKKTEKRKREDEEETPEEVPVVEEKKEKKKKKKKRKDENGEANEEPVEQPKKVKKEKKGKKENKEKRSKKKSQD
eukprot:TRINITY_DN10612_c0_g1_i1.p1 TRINITY_DN10612_c0_g1~~TRINITY_DN10612_c0_g1_i1.p1  ORF type:complete len:345 (+),score=121.67 TRINITY_DN10612_c0_g1_i1:135-1169(+)